MTQRKKFRRSSEERPVKTEPEPVGVRAGFSIFKGIRTFYESNQSKSTEDLEAANHGI